MQLSSFYLFYLSKIGGMRQSPNILVKSRWLRDSISPPLCLAQEKENLSQSMHSATLEKSRTGISSGMDI
jgi:hypothetical protein